MAVDLPEGLGSALLNESVSAHSSNMAEISGGLQFSNALLRSVATKKFDEVGAIESSGAKRAIEAGGVGTNPPRP